MNKLYEIIAKVLKEDVKNVSSSSSPKTLKNWDSFNALLIVDELEKEFKIKLNIEEVIKIKTVADIERYLKSKGIELG